FGPPPVGTPPPTVAPTPPPPPVTATTVSDTPANVEPQVQPTGAGKTPPKPGGKSKAPRIPMDPTDAIAISDLAEARAAEGRKDVDTAVRMAQRSYAAQDNLAAHYLAIKLRCQTGDLANAQPEASKIRPSELTQALIAECQRRDIELKKK
ncbi:hypothetical protein HMI50_27585, partial [Corallococcus carmarthensis]|nr:hypothetical protein [Corallococcus carmarthensis]